MVVIGCPTIPRQHIQALQPLGDESRVRYGLQLHGHPKVRQPLRLQKLRHRLVESIFRIVCVGEVFALGAVGISGQQKGPRPHGVEGRQRVGAVTEVTQQSLGDHPAGGRDASDVGADVLGQLGPIDRQGKRKPPVVRSLALVERERPAHRPRGVGNHVEAHEVGLVRHLEEHLCLLGGLRLDARDIGRGRRISAIAEDVKGALPVFRHRGRGIGHDLDMDLAQGRLRPSPPARNRNEVERLVGGARGHLEGAGADKGLRLAPPTVEVGFDDLPVHDHARSRRLRDRRLEPARRARQLCDYGGVVRRAQAAHGDRRVVLLEQGLQRRARGLVGGDVVVAGDRGQVRGEWSLHRGRAVPRIEHVLRGDWVPIGESHVGAQLEGVGQAVGGDGGHACRDIGDDVRVGVELEQAVEDVVGELGFGFAVDHRRIQGADVVLDRKTERLIARETRGGGVAHRPVRTRQEGQANERGQQRRPARG